MLVQYGAAQNDDDTVKRLWEDVLRSDAAIQMMCNVAHDYDNGIGVDFSGYGRDRKIRSAYNFGALRHSISGNGYPSLTRNISFTHGSGQSQLAEPGELLVDLNQEKDVLDIYADGVRVPYDTMPGSTAPWFDMLSDMLPDEPTIFHDRTTYISTLSAVGLGPIPPVSFGEEGRSDSYWDLYDRALYAEHQDQAITDEETKNLSPEELWVYLRGRSLYFFHTLDNEKPTQYLTDSVEKELFPQKQECIVIENDGVEEEECRILPEYNADLTTIAELASITPFDAVYINTTNSEHNSFSAAHSNTLVSEIVHNTKIRYEVLVPIINLISL
jgi:hypothetical protein